MPDAFSWTDLWRWVVSLFLRVMPDRLLRLWWSSEELLGKIEAFHSSDPPYFHIRADRPNPEMKGVSFDVFNFSPFRILMVGATLRVLLDARDEFFVHEERFSMEIPLRPFSRSEFSFRRPLGEGQVERLRGKEQAFVRIAISGGVNLRTPFGEQRKSISADTIARIDR